LAIVLRPDTYTHSPSQHWGYDQHTINRFFQSRTDHDALNDLPNDPSTRRALVLERYFNEWTAWRNSQIADWYTRMSDIVSPPSADVEPNDRKLYLAPIDLFRNPEITAALSPSLHRALKFDDVMGELSLKSEAIRSNPQIVFLKPHRVAPLHPPAFERVEYSIQGAKQFDEWFGMASCAGDLFICRSPGALSQPWATSTLFNRSLPVITCRHWTAAGDWESQPAAVALQKSDSQLIIDGAWQLSVSTGDALAEFSTVFSRLPAKRFETVPSSSETEHTVPVAVRQLAEDERLVFYAVNGSPWPVDVEIPVLGGGSGTHVQSFSAAAIQLHSDDRVQRLALRLRPFELAGGAFPDPSVRLGRYDFRVPEPAQEELRQAYFQIRSHLVQCGKAIGMDGLRNPGFEAGSADNFDGWSIGHQDRTRFQLIEGNANTGSRSLRIENRGTGSLWIRSNEFPSPETGRLSISVWLKIDDANNQPPLRISVENTRNGSNYYRFGSLGSLVKDGQQHQLTSQWQRFAVHFDDLPTAAGDTLRVGFDMIGPGEVWIDDVAIYNRWFGNNDITAMTQLLGGAGLLLEKTESLDQCRRVLEGYWPMFLRHYFAPKEPGSDDRPSHERYTDRQMIPPVQVDTTEPTNRFRRLVPPRVFQFR
jgi:hypothetical protein